MIHEPIFKLPENNDDLNKYLLANNEEGPGVFRFAPPRRQQRDGEVPAVLLGRRRLLLPDVFGSG
jgi:hypothetical protein